MQLFFHHLELCAPLFLLVFLGWGTVKVGMFDKAVSSGLSKFVFKLLMPVMLFQMMSHLSEMPPVDWRVLIAFFGSCIVVFTLGRQLGKRVFHQDSSGQVITGMGGIFGNNVQLGGADRSGESGKRGDTDDFAYHHLQRPLAVDGGDGLRGIRTYGRARGYEEICAGALQYL